MRWAAVPHPFNEWELGRCGSRSCLTAPPSVESPNDSVSETANSPFLLGPNSTMSIHERHETKAISNTNLAPRLSLLSLFFALLYGAFLFESCNRAGVLTEGDRRNAIKALGVKEPQLPLMPLWFSFSRASLLESERPGPCRIDQKIHTGIQLGWPDLLPALPRAAPMHCCERGEVRKQVSSRTEERCPSNSTIPIFDMPSVSGSARAPVT